MEIFIYVVIFSWECAVGFLLKRWLGKSKLCGTIFVTHNEEKTLYSLELSDYPETIEFKKEVSFQSRCF